MDNKDYEEFKRVMDILSDRVFRSAQEDVAYYTELKKETEKQEEKDFCDMRILEIFKAYNKQEKQIKEFLNKFADYMLDN